MKVNEILEKKGSYVYSIHPGATVYEALKKMADHNLGSLLVMDGKKIEGIFTERDYARKVILKGKFSKETAVSDIMHHAPRYVTKEDDIHACMNLMTDHFIRHLPVVEEGEVVGLISIGDVVKSLIEEQEFIISNLDQYISGTNSVV